jgi:hypothetical protein
LLGAVWVADGKLEIHDGVFKDLLDAGYKAVDVYRVSSTIITASEVENRAHQKLLWFSFLIPHGQCEDAVQSLAIAADSVSRDGTCMCRKQHFDIGRQFIQRRGGSRVI